MCEVPGRLVLYFDPRSPPARSCLMLVEMLQIKSVVMENIDVFKGEQYDKDFEEINPIRTVPVLRDNDLLLTDSHAILIHLCEKYANAEPEISEKMWPVNNYDDRINVLNRLMFEATVLFRRDSDTLSEIICKGYENTDINLHRRKIHETYEMMERYLEKTEYMAVDYMTIADISIISTLSTIDLLFPVDEDHWPRLFAWYDKMQQSTVYRINAEGLDQLCETLETYGHFIFPSKDVEE